MQWEVTTTNCSLVACQGFSVCSRPPHISAAVGRGQGAQLPRQSDLCNVANKKSVSYWCCICILPHRKVLVSAHCAAGLPLGLRGQLPVILDAQPHTNVTNPSSIQDTFCIGKFQSEKIIRCWYLSVEECESTWVLMVKLPGT